MGDVADVPRFIPWSEFSDPVPVVNATCCDSMTPGVFSDDQMDGGFEINCKRCNAELLHLLDRNGA